MKYRLVANELGEYAIQKYTSEGVLPWNREWETIGTIVLGEWEATIYPTRVEAEAELYRLEKEAENKRRRSAWKPK